MSEEIQQASQSLSELDNQRRIIKQRHQEELRPINLAIETALKNTMDNVYKAYRYKSWCSNCGEFVTDELDHQPDYGMGPCGYSCTDERYKLKK